MEPILHLSLPVRDLTESRQFYVEVLGCRPGRVRDGWIDVWFHGMQVTLHEAPDEVAGAAAGPGSRHFGVTLAAVDLDAVLAGLDGHPVHWVRPVATEFAGTPLEQTKGMLVDPSGNAIELKAYRDPDAALERSVATR